MATPIGGQASFTCPRFTHTLAFDLKQQPGLLGTKWMLLVIRLRLPCEIYGNGAADWELSVFRLMGVQLISAYILIALLYLCLQESAPA